MQVGARLAHASRMFDAVIECRSVDDVYAALDTRARMIVQVWSYGAPGAPVIGGRRISAAHHVWGNIETVWFRSCKVMQGAAGKVFAQQIANQGAGVVGHLANIGTFGHSYLVGLAPGRRAWWPDLLTPRHSHPFAPRTVSPLAMALPPWAFSERLPLRP